MIFSGRGRLGQKNSQFCIMLLYIIVTEFKYIRDFVQYREIWAILGHFPPKPRSQGIFLKYVMMASQGDAYKKKTCNKRPPPAY